MKNWKYFLLSMILFPFAGMVSSCSESDDDSISEFENWQQKNETYFEQQYQAHSVQSDTKFILPSWKQAGSKSLSDIAHTECILVDVIETLGITDVSAPLFTDSVEVHYRGRLLPSRSYPTGYEFDKSYYSSKLDVGVDVPYTCSPSGNLVTGFSTALQYMHRGDHWQVTIPYQLGYGTSDYETIPAYSTLIFDIWLEDF